MFQGSYANVFRFGSQLWELRFGSSCCTSIHIFLFIFSVWALGYGVRFRGYVWGLGLGVRFKVYNGTSLVQQKLPSDPTLTQKRAVFPAFSSREVT